MIGAADPRWQTFRRALAGRRLPAAFIDLDAFDRNVERLCAPLRASGKRLRIATKSLRCPELVRRIVERSGGLTCGLMTYTAEESGWWADEGVAIIGEAARDLVLAYPTVQPRDVADLVAANRTATCATIVDDPDQITAIADAARAAGVEVPLVVELDVSWRPLTLHVGVRRSPLHDARAVTELARRIASTPGVRFAGVMAYEAQIAGVTDRSAFHRWQNGARRAVKRLSRVAVERARAQTLRELSRAGLAPHLFNGGGTGSIAWAAADPSLTEITIGSGFVASHLFSGYRDLEVEPAAYFALQVVRRPAPGIVTCHGGGYVASGEAGPDRLPLPVHPVGCRLLALEGSGEVQTPVAVPDGLELALGDPIVFRHAKAGELAEHFNEYLLLRGDAIAGEAPTWRGLGKCFLG